MGPEERELAPGSFALDAVFERLAPVRIEEEGVRLAEDPEYLHRMRVATRRLRSALPLLSESVSRGDLAAWSREVRRFTQVLGKARDGDVQGLFVAEFLKNNHDDLRRPGLERLHLRLVQRRRGLQKRLDREMDRMFHHGGVLEGLENELRRQRVTRALEGAPAVSSSLRRRGATMLLLRLEALVGGSQTLARPRDVTGHHALRILAKKLRYTMELFAPLLEHAGGEGSPAELLRKVKALQGTLGDLHDCDLWIQSLPLFLEEERRRTEAYYGHLRSFPRLEKGIVSLLEDRRQSRDPLFSLAVEVWRSWEEERTTETLRERFRALAGEWKGGEAL